MKRQGPLDPLTADDVAERLDRAAVRTLRILMDVRQADGDLFEDVNHSRYLTNSLDLLIEELRNWRPT